MDAETLSHVEAAAQFLDCCGDSYHPKARAAAIRAMLAENAALRESLLAEQSISAEWKAAYEAEYRKANHP